MTRHIRHIVYVTLGTILSSLFLLMPNKFDRVTLANWIFSTFLFCVLYSSSFKSSLPFTSFYLHFYKVLNCFLQSFLTLITTSFLQFYCKHFPQLVVYFSFLMLLKYFEFLCSKSADIFSLTFSAFCIMLRKGLPHPRVGFPSTFMSHFLKKCLHF